MTPTAQNPQQAWSGAPRRPENLSLVYQELITVGERLRSNRQQVPDANSFRAQLHHLLREAQQEGRQRGYSDEHINLAQYAVVAFLDESILNLRSPIFADWPRRPLQEELYGHQLAGEVFFQNLEKLLRVADSHDVADLLEMHQLCLLLGFAGRYTLGRRGDLKGIMDVTGEKIRRIRQSQPVLSPQWALPQENIQFTLPDPWRKWMTIISLSCLALAAVSWLLYKFMMLPGGIDQIKQVVR